MTGLMNHGVNTEDLLTWLARTVSVFILEGKNIKILIQVHSHVILQTEMFKFSKTPHHQMQAVSRLCTEGTRTRSSQPSHKILVFVVSHEYFSFLGTNCPNCDRSQPTRLEPTRVSRRHGSRCLCTSNCKVL